MTNNFGEIYKEADRAGMEALNKCLPNPMIVEQHVNQLDDNSPVAKSWFVEDGVCGFAWVNVKPGNSPFANFLKANDLGRKDSYYGGVTIWVTAGNQSMQKKEAYAEAFAEVLNQNGIKAYAASRLD